jgi:kynureninase
VPALFAATAGYEAILDVGVERIRAWSVRLTERLRRALLERGFTVPSPEDPARRGGTLTVGLRPEEQGRACVAALAARRILVDHRPNAGLRVSPHFYTREEELDEFADVLDELRRTGRWRDHASSSAAY